MINKVYLAIPSVLPSPVEMEESKKLAQVSNIGIPTFLCSLIYFVIGLSVSGLPKIRFNAYTFRRISTKNQFPHKPGFPLSALIILDCSSVDRPLFKRENGRNNHDQ